MTSNPLGLRLASIEIIQRENPATRLDEYDRGLLAAVRRHGDAELVARVDAVEKIEDSRARRRAAATRMAQR